jgi:HK97 family phage major capsid protein
MAKDLRELHEKRVKSVADARVLVDAADNEKRAMTSEEETQYNAYMADEKRYNIEIKRETDLAEAERRNAEMVVNQAGANTNSATPEAEIRTAAFRNLLVQGAQSLSSAEMRSLTTGSDTQAGFLNAPQEFVQQLIERVRDEVFIEAASTKHTTTNANGLGFPTLETYPGQITMISEIGTSPEDTALAFGKREFKPHLAKKLIKISDKMLRADGMNAEALAIDAVSYMISITKEYMYLLGTGNQEPLGLFVADAKGIPTTRDITTDMTATDFTPDALKNTKYSLKAQYMKTAQWLFHRDAVAKVAKLKDGEGRYMFDTSDKVGAVDTLLGRPLMMSEYVPNTFTASKYVGMFGDLSKYWTVNSLALRIKRLNELFAATSQVGFQFEVEFDGMPVLAEAFSRIKTAAS